MNISKNYIWNIFTYIWGGPQNLEFLYKNCVFILICLNFSNPQSTFHLIQYTYLDIFFHYLKQFLNLSILMPFSATAGLFHLFHISNMFSFEGFFHTRETKQSHWGWGWVNREGGAWGSYGFWSKTAEHSAWWGQMRL